MGEITGTADLCSFCFAKLAWHSLLSPDLSSGALRAPQEMVVPLLEVSIDCIFSSFCGRVIAIVDDPFSHAAEDGLYYVEELRASRQGRCLHDREAVLGCLLVD